MRDWLARNHRTIVGNSRWTIMACGLALMALDALPRDPIGYALAMIGVMAVAVVFTLWAIVVGVAVIRPRTFDQRPHRHPDQS